MPTPANFSRPPAVAVPSVAVIDNFAEKMVDIDGDGTPDLSHGDTVERIVRAYHPGARITRFPFQKSLIRRDLQPSDKFSDLTGALENLKRAVKNGDHFDAVNLASGDYQPLPARKTPFWQKAFWRPENRAVRAAIKNVQALSTQLPVYLPAGNFRNDAFNVLSLANNINTVAATDACGRLTEYTMDNDRVTHYAQGTYAVTKVNGGFDITGDGKADVGNEEVSGGTPFAVQFIGKPLGAVLASSKTVERITAHLREKQSTPLSARYNLYGFAPIEGRLFKADDLLAANALSQSEYAHIKGLGNYVAYQSSDAWKNGVWEVFDIDDDGRVTYNPDGSGRNAINRIWGTSWAGPTALANDLQGRLCNPS